MKDNSYNKLTARFRRKLAAEGILKSLLLSANCALAAGVIIVLLSRSCS